MAYSIVRPVGCYVYTHRKATTGDIFYVGKGTAERAWDRYGRTAYWQNVVAKHGFVVQIESDGLLEFEAFARERDLIASLRARGVRLVNLTDGGEGTLNPSDETRAKLSAYQRGRKKSADHIEKIRQANTGKLRTEETKRKLRARVMTDEWRMNMSKAGLARAAKNPLSAETLEKISNASKRNWASEEYRSKVLSAVTGKKRSAAFCEKMAAISLARPPASPEVREAARQTSLAKWSDPEYRAKMKAAHAGRGWSAERRAAYEAGEKARRSESMRASRSQMPPEERSRIASIAGRAGKAKRDELRARDASDGDRTAL